MFTHPYIGSQLAHQQQHDMLAQAAQQRLARQFREQARATRRAQLPGRRIAHVLKRTRPTALPA
jgi:hypothetical protein